jgi:hypothetical protein
MHKRGLKSQKKDIFFLSTEGKVTKETLLGHIPMTLTPMAPYANGRKNNFFMT